MGIVRMRRALATKSKPRARGCLAVQRPAKIAKPAPTMLASMLTQVATDSAIWWCCISRTYAYTAIGATLLKRSYCPGKWQRCTHSPWMRTDLHMPLSPPVSAGAAPVSALAAAATW